LLAKLLRIRYETRYNAPNAINEDLFFLMFYISKRAISNMY
jgi:hypothetical protein